MPEAIRPHLIQIVAIAGGAVALWFFWKLARAVVKWGFFILYFVLGSCIAWLFQPTLNVGVTLAGGLAFAWTVMAIRSKLWKFIGAVAVIAAIPFFGPVSKAIANWSKRDEPPAQVKSKPVKPAK